MRSGRGVTLVGFDGLSQTELNEQRDVIVTTIVRVYLSAGDIAEWVLWERLSLSLVHKHGVGSSINIKVKPNYLTLHNLKRCPQKYLQTNLQV